MSDKNSGYWQVIAPDGVIKKTGASILDISKSIKRGDTVIYRENSEPITKRGFKQIETIGAKGTTTLGVIRPVYEISVRDTYESGTIDEFIDSMLKLLVVVRKRMASAKEKVETQKTKKPPSNIIQFPKKK